jgi:hypothetical protein
MRIEAGLLLLMLLSLLASSNAETNVLMVLEKDPVMSKKLGLAKLSKDEKQAWNNLLVQAFELGRSGGSGREAKASALATANSGSRLWLSKADLDGKEVILLRNGAIFQVSSGYVGYGYSRDVALIQDGSRWTLWVSGKREFRGTLLQSPKAGTAVGFSRKTVSKVISDGSVVMMDDNTVYNVDSVAQIHTSLWLPLTEVLALETDQLINLNDATEGVVKATRLK